MCKNLLATLIYVLALLNTLFYGATLGAKVVPVKILMQNNWQQTRVARDREFLEKSGPEILMPQNRDQNKGKNRGFRTGIWEKLGKKFKKFFAQNPQKQTQNTRQEASQKAGPDYDLWLSETTTHCLLFI